MQENKNYGLSDNCDEIGAEDTKKDISASSDPRTAPEQKPGEVEKIEKTEIVAPQPKSDWGNSNAPELIPPVTPREPEVLPREPEILPRREQQRAPDAQYHWSYEEQRRHDDKKRRRGSGVLSYAIIMTIAFSICLVTLLGVVMMETGMFTPDITRTIFVREYDSESGVLTIAEIADKVKPSVVGIEVTIPYGSTTTTGVGTGIILSEDGYIATNYHVVDEGLSYRVVLSDKTEYEAIYVGGDELSDLALIKIDASGLPAAELGNSDELIVGELAVAIGTPAGLDFAGTTTDGIISAISRDTKIYDDTGVMVKRMTLIQTNAAVNPGNSGGPLINDRGQVIGIITMKLSGDYDGIGFAIPINGAMTILNEIKEHGSTSSSSGVASKRPLIGITAGGVREGEQYTFEDGTTGVAPITGVLIIEVTEGLDAANKLRVGDIIVEVDGKAVDDIYDVMTIVNNKYGGDTVTIKYYRDGLYNTTTITLGTEQ
ncbi:MAG: trypsin-like peptidase domain-containing protein [Clostridia bacterium]|nr:trypsin-like peptidase domain-containing protein [Clostridia bacterium]